ncbi:preprotein translocase subunit YajC [Thermodesulfovibrionales bacterium]|nr:preprotein translocase subunit YajC [Thermodesulfovibrionales bacterium]
MHYLSTFIADAYAASLALQGGTYPGLDEIIWALLPFILIFVVFYFLLIRPQQQKAKQHKYMLANLKRGDKVITTGGIYGLVESVGNKSVTLKVSENIKVKFGKSYITNLRHPTDED